MIARTVARRGRITAGSLRKLLARDERGAAAIEFALLSSTFFLAASVAMDFGSLFIERGKMNEAVSAAAVSAFSSASNVDFPSLPGYVRALANNQNLTVTNACNGTIGSCTNLNRTCSCLRTDGTFAATTCGNACAGANMTPGSTAGYYLTIRGTQTFSPLIVPRGILGNTQISQQATVRLQ